MSKTVILPIEKREKAKGSAGKQLRKIGYVPGAINVRGEDSLSIKMKEDDLLKTIAKFGKNSLFTLELGDETFTTMIKEMQHSPIRRNVLNVVFQQVSTTEKIEINLMIRVIGKEAIERKEYIIAQQLDRIEITGLPQDIPDAIEIDVTGLDLNDHITIGDVEFPEGIETEMEADQIVLVVTESRLEESLDDEEEVVPEDMDGEPIMEDDEEAAEEE